MASKAKVAQVAPTSPADALAALIADFFASSAVTTDTASATVAPAPQAPAKPRLATIIVDGKRVTGEVVNVRAEQRAAKIASGAKVACEMVVDGKPCTGTMNPARTTRIDGRRACGKHF